jgi:hypothetical protein
VQMYNDFAVIVMAVLMFLLVLRLDKSQTALMRSLRAALRLKYPEALIIEDFRMAKGGMCGWCKVSLGFKDGPILQTPEMRTPEEALEAALNLR